MVSPLLEGLYGHVTLMSAKLPIGLFVLRTIALSLVYFASQHLYSKVLSWMIEIWMKGHLVSNNHCKIVDL
jgi:hypothetical protein